MEGEEKRKKKEKLIEKGKYASEFSGGPEVYIVFFKLTGIGKRAVDECACGRVLGIKSRSLNHPIFWLARAIYY